MDHHTAQMEDSVRGQWTCEFSQCVTITETSVLNIFKLIHCKNWQCSQLILMSCLSLVGKKSNYQSWLQHKACTYADCLLFKGPHLHYAACNVLSLCLLSFFACKYKNWKGNQNFCYSCHWKCFPRAQLMEYQAGKEKAERAKSLGCSNRRLCCLLILIILNGWLAASSFAHKHATHPRNLLIKAKF